MGKGFIRIKESGDTLISTYKIYEDGAEKHIERVALVAPIRDLPDTTILDVTGGIDTTGLYPPVDPFPIETYPKITIRVAFYDSTIIEQVDETTTNTIVGDPTTGSMILHPILYDSTGSILVPLPGVEVKAVPEIIDGDGSILAEPVVLDNIVGASGLKLYISQLPPEGVKAVVWVLTG